MLDDILDLFRRDRNRKRPGNGVRGLVDRLGDHDDDRASNSRNREHDDDWDDDDRGPRQGYGGRRRESQDWDD